ncbi:LPS export ABC transporter permease LptG [Pseudomonas sp. G11-1]|uniref:Lipopolysaccharide export system permease protein n=1 Tax=Halopseudomonas bauzanensis TaxID=653930 RepID=A0A031M911_9GAMM|nr:MULTISPECIES: LPS export ABC transporter permease LptG [Halopseudomonas]MCO5787329.1 LPS export ABC transporter permease LptG [Pseudomonas sp. G11-1]MCO5790554.1 LPS export ABC transporter permease LptG [Pseudomonas sp. G11-2]EZQ15943.1 permease [Halopseudomonas bauzanensis]WGK62207.1 LPS export ABC transporter permease LptG [Halopseudomonas sp. SMJS2]SES32355.1 lipopolysaccharide export system permease protein [Halopseudomonas bauzanensis]
MRLLDRHIGKSIFLSVLTVALIIVGLDLLFAYISELEDLEGNYGAIEALTYIFLTSPRRLYELLPMAALVGCLIGLGTLASNSELTVMRASGVSIARIMGAVLKPLLVLMVAGVLLGEYVAPYSENLAESRRALAVGSGDAVKSKGLWHREGDDFIHINAVQPNGVLHGITRYRFDDQRELLETSFAQRASVQDEHWLLEEVATTLFDVDGTSRVEQHEQQRWDVGLSPRLLRVVLLDPDVLPLTGIWHYQNYLAEQGLNNSQYWLAFWKKLLQPLTTAALVFVAISFIFGPLRSVTLGQRVFTGVLVGFSFRILQDLLGPSSLVFGFSPLIAVVLPILILVVMGGWLMRRAG